MIDKFYFKSKKDLFSSFAARGFVFNYLFFERFDSKVRRLKTKIYVTQHKYKVMSSFIKLLKFRNISFRFFLNEIYHLKFSIYGFKIKLNFLEKILNDFLFRLPNLLHKSVYFGLSSADNVEIRVFYFFDCIRKRILRDFENSSSNIDFKLSSEISGSGFVILKKALAQLYRALGNYMLDLHIFEHGYKEIYSPLIVKGKSMFNTGHFPKFINDQFNVSDSDMWLIPTAEVVLANIIADLSFDMSILPLKFVSKTSCFRKERGNYGSKVRGLIRQHQFDKVELLNIVMPGKSYYYLEELLYHAEKVLQNLCLPYRIISLCSSDVGFSSSKTYDIEAWFPKRKMYIEVSSCSNTESFQSLRMNSKIVSKGRFIGHPHILNGSGLAMGRVLLCIIENYSDIDGNLSIPDILIKYMNGVKLIKFLE